MIPILIALLTFTAAPPTGVGSSPRLAACAAQTFLRANGYLDTAPSSAPEGLQLGIWDGVQYSKNGHFDYEAMIRERRNLYSGRLIGVMTDSDGGFSVVYRLEGQGGRDHSCLRVTPDLRSVVIIDATCMPSRPVKRFSERSLSCPEAA